MERSSARGDYPTTYSIVSSRRYGNLAIIDVLISLRFPRPHVGQEMKFDLHTHFYTEKFFQTIRDLPSEFSFGTSSSGQTIITYRGARFFGVTPAMTDVSKRLEDMDRVGIDVEVISLSTPNVFFTDAEHQPAVARM